MVASTFAPAKPMSLDTLGQSPLKAADGSDLSAAQLWAKSPTVVLIVRRPGCVLCRDEAQKLWALNDQFNAMGVNLVAVVHEWNDKEIEAFVPEFWGGPLYHDTSKAFYKYVGGGELKYGNPLVLGNPFGDIWARIAAARKNVRHHNLVGEGLVLGGLIVVGAGGNGPSYTHFETEFGVHPSHADVLEAARKAVDAQRV